MGKLSDQIRGWHDVRLTKAIMKIILGGVLLLEEEIEVQAHEESRLHRRIVAMQEIINRTEKGMGS